MNDVILMGVIESGADIPGNAKGFVQSWPGHLSQRLSLYQFHNDKGYAVIFAGVIDGDYVGVVQPGRCPCFVQ